METYNKQVADIQERLRQLQNPLPQMPSVVHKIIPVDGMAAVEAILREMPAGSSDIVAHKTENIMYLLAKDENGVPAPIQPMKYEMIEIKQDPTSYVTRADFDQFKNELKEELKAELKDILS